MAAECTRFEEEGLLKLERGERLDEHHQSCADCQAKAEGYVSLQRNLAQVPRETAPGNWEAKVWAEIARREQKRKARWLWPVLAPLAVAAAGLLVTVVPSGTGYAEPGLELTVMKIEGETLRGTSAQPGDILGLKASRGDYQSAEVRVYRDGVLAWRCGTGISARDCAVEDGTVSGKMTLVPVGHYEPVLLLWNSGDGLPAGTGRSMTSDLDEAVRQGARIIPAQQVDVY